MATMSAEKALLEPPLLDIDPYSDEVLADPYPFQEILRETAPVVRLGQYGVYAVGRHAEATTVFADVERFSSAGGIGIQDIRKPGLFRVPSRILEVDPPDHTRVRSVMNKLLSPVVLRQWREMFSERSSVLVERLLDMGEFDGVADAAEAYVFEVFAEAVGVQMPLEATLAIGLMRFNQSGPPNKRYHDAMAIAEPYVSWFESSCEREAMIAGGLGEKVFEAEERGDLEPGIASNIVRSLIGGGTDSTISGIGATLLYLAGDPAQFEIVKANPRKINAAFEEGIRLNSPFQIVYRTTREETELSGYRLDADAKIAIFPGAANRDPRRWEEPDRMDVNRRTIGQLAFGSGIHLCLGQMIARLEAECLIGALTKAASSLELAGEPRFRLINQLRTLDTLPLRARR